MGLHGTKPTWKPETAAPPWTVAHYTLARVLRRRRILKRRLRKFGNYTWLKRPKVADPIHKGPCTVTEIVTYQPSLIRRIFKREKKHVWHIAGKGHRLVAFDKFGNRMWHPRYADMKVCIVCKRTFHRVPAPKAGA